jgi:hypothetical protein
LSGDTARLDGDSSSSQSMSSAQRDEPELSACSARSVADRERGVSLLGIGQETALQALRPWLIG